MTRPASLEFSTRVKRQSYDRANGKCECGCGAPLTIGKIAYDHVLPIALGGQPTLANCRCITVDCHKAKTATDVGRIRKADRQKAKAIGAKAPKQEIKSPGFARVERTPIAEKFAGLPRRSFYGEA